MRNEIKLLKNNDNRSDSDLDWINEFYYFLQGEIPKGMKIARGHQPKMSEKKAASIIWYLQEHFHLLPDHIERCDTFGALFDSWSSGIYWETKGKNYCGGCDYLVPQNYDKGKK